LADLGCDPSPCPAMPELDLALQWAGEMVWSVLVDFTIPGSDQLNSVSLEINGEDITTSCYLSEGNWLVSPVIVMSGSGEEITVTALVTTVGGLSVEREIAFTIDDEDVVDAIDLFFDQLDDVPLSIVEDFIDEHPPGGSAGGHILTLQHAAWHMSGGETDEALEVLAEGALNAVPPIGYVDFAIRTTGFQAYLLEGAQGTIPDEEWEEIQHDHVLVAATKLMMYASLGFAEYAAAFDPVFGTLPDEFYPNPLPGVPDPPGYQLWQLFDDLSTQVGEVFDGIEGIVEGINEWIQSVWDWIWRLLAFSPVDLLVVNAEGDSLSKEEDNIPRSMYFERTEVPPGSWEDLCLFYRPLLESYTVHVISEDGAGGEETYSLLSVAGDDTTILAQDVPIAQIPEEGYSLNLGQGMEDAVHEQLPGLRVWPNPVVGTAHVQYRLPAGIGQEAELSIYDPAGRLVRTLVDVEELGNRYAIDWDGTNQAGKRLAPGAYFHQLKWNGGSVEGRLIFVR
ncbi:FlgD immunoglobulin-like domain containing protein, partial [Candidatus Eisenbacteria bacterium]